MLIIDRYIIRQFLINFAILLFVFMSLFVLGDVIIDLDEFLEAGGAWAERHDANAVLGLLLAVIDYDGPMVVLLYVFFCGLLVVGAAGFTFAGLARSHEMVALVASGISMHRVAMPVLIVGCLLNALAIVNQELIIPRLAVKLARSKSELKNLDGPRHAILFAPDDSNSLLSAASFDPTRNMLEEVTIIQRNAEGHTLRRITATQAWWNPQHQYWELEDGWAIERTGAEESSVSTAPEPKEMKVWKDTKLTPTVLQERRASIYPRLLSYRELNRLKGNKAVVNQDLIRQIMHSRISLLVMNMLVLVMGLPFFLMREPSNILMQSVKAAAVCLGAWSFGLVTLEMGATQLNPVAAAWLPVVLYLPVSAVLLQCVKT